MACGGTHFGTIGKRRLRGECYTIVVLGITTRRLLVPVLAVLPRVHTNAEAACVLTCKAKRVRKR
eukprot:3733630-Rhodomonas_salina.5